MKGTREQGGYQYLAIPCAQAKERFVSVSEVNPWEIQQLFTLFNIYKKQTVANAFIT